jgi:hypothetical protein
MSPPSSHLVGTGRGAQTCIMNTLSTSPAPARADSRVARTTEAGGAAPSDSEAVGLEILPADTADVARLARAC